MFATLLIRSPGAVPQALSSCSKDSPQEPAVPCAQVEQILTKATMQACCKVQLHKNVFSTKMWVAFFFIVLFAASPETKTVLGAQ